MQRLVVIDAGSSGTRVHVFTFWWSSGEDESLPFVQLPEPSFRVAPGLSSFASQPKEAGKSLRPLLAFAKEHVPAEDLSNTSVLLLATAGLRLLPADASAAILASCRATLATSGLKFLNSSATIITGDQEGLYAWLAANFATGALKAPVSSTPGADRCVFGRTAVTDRRMKADAPAVDSVGIVEMGGASLQLTFQGAAKVPPPYAVKMGLPHRDGCTLFSHSFIGYGREEMRRQVVLSGQPGSVTPCFNKGFSESDISGAGNLDECMGVIRSFLKTEGGACNYDQCILGNVPYPGLVGKLLATENFARVVRGLGLSEDAKVRDVASAGKGFCSREWKSVLKAYPKVQPQELSKWCFTASYTVVFMQDVLRLGPDATDVRFVRELRTAQGQKVGTDWALGAMLSEAVRAPRVPPGAAKGPPTAFASQGGPVVVEHRTAQSSTVGLRWTLFWVAVIAVIIWLVRKYMPRLWGRVCSTLGLQRNRRFFDMERGAYVQDISERVKMTMTGVHGAVVGTVSSMSGTMMRGGSPPLTTRSTASGRPFMR